jgi:S1-C subfamily serine protease
VNLLDAVVVLAAIGAGYAGYRNGFTARALGWIGLVVGITVGALFVDDVANALQGSTPRTRLIASIAFLFLVAVLGQALGIALGSLLRRSLPGAGVMSTADRVGGAVAGVVAVLTVVWLLVPALANATGWPARAVRGSAIARAIDRYAPSPPSSLSALGQLVGDAPFPEVFDRLTSPDVGTPPTDGLAPEVAARVLPSVVRIEGRACDLIQQGSGFVAADDIVVTNAHVVGGEAASTVFTPDGRDLDAVVVAFDPNRDLAVLRVPGLALNPLDRGNGEVDSTGAVVGYPGGGPETVSPSSIAQRITAKGTNIYRTASTSREVFVLAAALEPGDSGGALVDASGRVVGSAFAVDPSSETTAYALTNDEVERVLGPVVASGASAGVDTGPCLVG